MINKFRRKCILIAMISVTLVLSFIVMTINVVNHIRMTNSADKLIFLILENGGSFDHTIDANHGLIASGEEFNDETPFETRYFVVIKKADNSLDYDFEHIASVDENVAVDLMIMADNKGATRGYVSEYRYGKTTDNGVTLYVFVNCYKSISSARNFMVASFFVSVIGLMFVFILVYLFSGLIIKPIQESYEKQKSFITNASHEMKTPLTIISANNEIIELEYGKSESTEAVSNQVRKLTTMVKDMTTLARLDEKEKLDKVKNVNISEILIQCCDDFKPAFTNEKKDFILNIEDNVMFACDISLIRKLFVMLLDNAYKYCLTFTNVSLYTDGKEIAIEISNDAEGIKSGSLNNLFERFKRSEEARGSGIEGSGIGLSVAYEIVKLHKGEITATGYEKNIFSIRVLF